MNYWKMISMVVATILSAILAAVTGDQIVSPDEWINVAILAVGALSVLTAPNVPGANYTKVILAVLSAVLIVVNSAWVGGFSVEEVLQMVLAGLGAVGVYSAKYNPVKAGVLTRPAGPRVP